MAIDSAKYDVFQSGSDFEKIHFLDNFYENINIEIETEIVLGELLKLAIKSSNDYIKRSAFIIHCDLTLANKIENPFHILSVLHEWLNCESPTLQAIAIKYLPHFPQMHNTATVAQLKEFSDNVNGEVSSQAYFCLGLFQLTEAISFTSTTDVISYLEKAKVYFQAAEQSIENRVDADFYLLVIKFLKSVLGNDKKVVEIGFHRLEENLSIRNLYNFGCHGIELDFLVFQLVDQLRINFLTSHAADRWLEVKRDVSVLFHAYEGLRRVRDSTSSSQYLTRQLFSTVFESIEAGIYQTHLSASAERLKTLQNKEGETPLSKYLCQLINILPDDGQAKKDNHQLLAMLSEIAGSENALSVYENIANKSVSADVLREFDKLSKKFKSQSFPFKTGTITGQEVYNELRDKIRQYLPDYSEDKLEAYFRIVEEVIRYARTSFVGNDRRPFSFLYAKDNKFTAGKGQNAVEQDLQDSMLLFLEHSMIKDGLDHEKARFVDGGRVDILYKKDLITIPIELKKSLHRPTRSDLEALYIAQAQTYAAGYDQLGILVLLELSDKKKEPPPNFKDWFDIHHIQPATNSNIHYPDYVISLIIPGNRTSPNSKSTYK